MSIRPGGFGVSSPSIGGSIGNGTPGSVLFVGGLRPHQNQRHRGYATPAD